MPTDLAALVALPRSLRLASWGHAALAGRVSLDEAVTRIVGADTRHRMTGLPAQAAEVGLSLGLGALRAHGAAGLSLVLPAMGDPVGLAGPPDFNADATLAGEAVLAVRHPPGAPGVAGGAEVADGVWGCIPTMEPLGSSGTSVRWQVAPAVAPRLAPSLAEADRQLAQAMREATDVLTGLDVARWDPAVTATVARLREPDERERPLAPGYPARAHRVLALGRWVRALVTLARASEGGAATAGQMGARMAVLAELERVSRRAIMAACNAPLEPGAS